MSRGCGVVRVRLRVVPLPVSATVAPAAARTVKHLVPPLRSGKMVNSPEDGISACGKLDDSTSGTVSRFCCRAPALLTWRICCPSAPEAGTRSLPLPLRRMNIWRFGWWVIRGCV